jgi:hypothetical protein
MLRAHEIATLLLLLSAPVEVMAPTSDVTLGDAVLSVRHPFLTFRQGGKSSNTLHRYSLSLATVVASAMLRLRSAVFGVFQKVKKSL